jgi:DNA polymerase-3 subunit delta
MAQRKAHEVDSWLAKPDPVAVGVLIYGPDRGLVSERAAIFAKSTGLPLDDPFAVIKYDGSSVDSDPGNLIDEAHMVPMFGGRRLLWVRNAGTSKAFVEAMKQLLAKPPADAILLLEAGDLKKAAPLRDAFESAFSGMALPCFQDEDRTVEQVLDQELKKAGKTIAPEARRALRPRLGGDRLATRGEIDKLILYVGEAQEISLADVEASSGDTSSVSADDAIDAAVGGNLAELDRNLQRAFMAGTHAQVLLGGAMRQFQALHQMRRQIDVAGVTPSAAVAGARPPVFFARRKAVEAALGRWQMTSIMMVLSRLNDALLQTRRQPDLAQPIIRQTLMAIASESARGARRSR